MCLLLRDEKLANKLEAGGRATVLDRFSWEAIAKRYLAFYEKYL
jgi:glycosyltransferase involved in cell wall biosynthesis